MSFLEFVVHELWGPPRYGEDNWHCPFCDPMKEKWVSFTVLPPKDNLPIKFRCHRCQRWGDEFDLVKFFYKANYESSKLVVAELLEKYRRSVGVSTLGEKEKAHWEQAKQLSRSISLIFAQRGGHDPSGNGQ